MTYLAFSFCDLEWWHVILAWLLPFLLGLLLGYGLWQKYKKMKEDLEKDVRGLKKKITDLEAELDACHHEKTNLSSEISLLKGQLREKNLQISTLESSLDAANKKGGGKTSSIAAGAAGLAAGLAAKGKDKEKKDDLQKIEGIGPKIEKLLNEEKIKTYSSLADTKVNKLRKLLDSAGPKFQIAQPDTWPEQAALARDGKWSALDKLQKNLKGGAVALTGAAVAGTVAKKDDLKKIEGIGPKIEGILNDQGIKTFADLAKTEVGKLQKLLDDAGPRYRIAIPDTWPEQASLARDDKWKELKSLQENLKGGKKT